MSSIVTKILSSTAGLLVNKARNLDTTKLSGSDVEDGKIRDLVVKEFNDVEAKMSDLSRKAKDLVSSCSSLNQGIDLLNYSLKKSMGEDVVDTSTDEQAASTMPSSDQSEILNDALMALSQKMEKLNVVSVGNFELYAKKRFENASQKANEAFLSEDLSIENRLMAAKLYIVATILECLKSPENAIKLCLSFLKKLHGLGEIAEIFSVYLKAKGFLHKAQRVECVKSVMLINYTLFQFVFKFSREYISAFTWPTIELKERSFNPILHWQEISTRKSMGDELTQLPNQLIHDEDIFPGCSAVNSYGDVVIENGAHRGSIKIIPKTGKSKVVNLPVPSEGNVHKRTIKGLAVDKNNNVYVVSVIFTDTSRDNGYYVLDALDENYNAKQTPRRLEYLKEVERYFGKSNVKIAVKKTNDIVMIKDDSSQMFVCDSTGKFKRQFEQGSRYVGLNLLISEQDEIIIASSDVKTIQIYSEKRELKSTIKLPEGHEARSLAFNYVICKIIVLTYVEEKNSFFLLCYTESGRLETEMFLNKRIGGELPKILSHPSGACVIVGKKSISVI